MRIGMFRRRRIQGLLGEDVKSMFWEIGGRRHGWSLRATEEKSVRTMRRGGVEGQGG